MDADRYSGLSLHWEKLGNFSIASSCLSSLDTALHSTLDAPSVHGHQATCCWVLVPQWIWAFHVLLEDS